LKTFESKSDVNIFGVQMHFSCVCRVRINTNLRRRKIYEAISQLKICDFMAIL